MPPLPAITKQLKPVIGVCLLLAAAVWIVFGQALKFDFVNLDDDAFVYENPLVKQGLTSEGFITAFTGVQADNWTPLTTLSHMADCDFFGMDAGGHHLTNILLHTASAILLFLVLRQMTATLWPAAFVAALFAIHPLRVESVAWVSERKDTLSGACFMLTLWAYVRYVRRPPSLSRYLGVAAFFALGLMAKPMLVTLPLILLLLDYWPLKRFTPAGLAKTVANPSFPAAETWPAWKLVLEKIPLLVLAFASCLPTILAEKQGIQSVTAFPFPLRIANALVSCVFHVGRMFYPVNLAAFYPYPEHSLPPAIVALAAGLLVVISLAAYVARRSHPYFWVGWLWYLIMLLPVIGLVQVGLQARADRHTYLPQIGLYLLLTWAAADMAVRWQINRRVLAIGALGIVAVLIGCARTQTANWRNSETLWNRTLICTTDNYVAQGELGATRREQGQWSEAILDYQKALKINPSYAQAYLSLGDLYVLDGQMQKAVPNFEKAMELSPYVVELLKKNYPFEVPDNVAWHLATNPDARIRNGPRAVELAERVCNLTQWENPVCLGTLAAAYAEAGRFDEAIATAQKACALAEKSDSPPGLLQKNQELLRLYRTHKPYRDFPPNPPATASPLPSP